jgi:uncharacterized protein
VLQQRAQRLVVETRGTPQRETTPARRTSSRQTPTEAAVKSFLRSVSSTLGREIMRGILGAIRKR